MFDGNHDSRAALVIAHPSHELRIHGWLQRARPRVFVLTDGSGREEQPRLTATTRILHDLDAPAGSVYGRVSDRDVYNAFLRQDVSFFIDLVEELAEEFDRQRIEYVVGDSAEGYSPTHDACRLLVDAAVEIVARRHGRKIANFDFAVVGLPDECAPALSDEAIWIQLDDEAFARKVSAARGYSGKLALDVEAALRGAPFQGVKRLSEPQRAGEVDEQLSNEIVKTLLANPGLARKFKHVFDGVGLTRFRTECLRPVSVTRMPHYEPAEGFFYELYGEKMVAEGHYRTTIRYTDHLRPLEEAVWRHVENQRERLLSTQAEARPLGRAPV